MHQQTSRQTSGAPVLKTNDELMKITNITDTHHPFYPAFRQLYTTSFPDFEQRSDAQQRLAFTVPGYCLDLYHCHDKLTGFLSYWLFDDYIYIEHFAVASECRGQGYGSSILQAFVSARPLTVLLEIDPVTDEQSAARLKFYQRCGFVKNPFPHVHPPYHKKYEGHSLLVLTTPKEINEKTYARFSRDLAVYVMEPARALE